MARPRFEGAVTTPDAAGEIDDQSIVPEPSRPDRPILVELASAILIVGGLTSLIGSLAALDWRPDDALAEREADGA